MAAGFIRETWQAGWRALLKQVSLDFKDLTGNGRMRMVMRGCPLQAEVQFTLKYCCHSAR